MKAMKRIFCIVFIIAMLLCGCGQTRNVIDNQKDEQIKELCVLYTQENEILISNFENLYPEYELEKVFLDGNIDAVLDSGITPDIIMAQGSSPLMQWYEKGYIREFGSYLSEDDKIDEEDYFPGALTVGREEDLLLALPLSAQVTYLTVRQSMVEETTFRDLQGEYTLNEYLDVLEEEYSHVIEEGTMVVSGYPFYLDIFGLLFASGAITIDDGETIIDQEVFERLYNICAAFHRNFEEDALVSSFTYRDAAIDPRDGEYVAASWGRTPPQVGVLYAQSVNQELMNEEIDVFWWPTAGETGGHAAKISTLGMIGAESQSPQAAYEVLRLMMDMPQKEWIHPRRNDSMAVNMYMPIHIENAKELCTYVETTGITKFNVSSTGNENVAIQKQVWDEELKESVLNMLEGIEYVYRVDDSIYADAYAVATYEYIYAQKANGATACYEDVLRILNADKTAAAPMHDGDYFSFTPGEYTDRLTEVLDSLGYEEYVVESGSTESYSCVINYDSQMLAEAFFAGKDVGSAVDENTEYLYSIDVSLYGKDLENLNPVISAILMTGDPTLDLEDALELIEKIPIWYSEIASLSTGLPFAGIPDPYLHNDIGYTLEKVSGGCWFLSISLENE